MIVAGPMSDQTNHKVILRGDALLAANEVCLAVNGCLVDERSPSEHLEVLGLYAQRLPPAVRAVLMIALENAGKPFPL